MRSRADRRGASGGSPTTSSSPSSPCSGRSTAATSTPPCCCAACRRRRARAAGPGENAGVIDGGDGLALAFKVESHNHPSAIEPFQGAATASAASCATSSRWVRGRSRSWTRCASAIPASAHARRLLDGAVRGIGSYGNCVGVANVGGEVVFEPGYEQNCLVNAMCVGVLPRERVQTARPPAGQRRGAVRRVHGPRRHRRRLRARLAGHRPGRREKRPTRRSATPSRASA